MSESDVKRILNICTALAKEKDSEQIFDFFVDVAMEITNCDGAILLIKNAETWAPQRLRLKSVCLKGCSKILMDKATFFFQEQPLICNVFKRVVVNVKELTGEDPDLSPWKNFDRLLAYKTVSMLAVALRNDEEELVGGLFLLNAMDKSGQVIPFQPLAETILLSVGSQMATRYCNMKDSLRIHDLFDSFVRVMSTGIDARTPYNANHTKNMVRCADGFIDWLDETGQDWHFTPSEKRQFLMCVWLHDIGKLAIPSEVMDKANRLGSKMERIISRFREIGFLDEIRCLRGELTAEEKEHRKKALCDAAAVIDTVNQIGYLSDEMLSHVQEIAQMVYYNSQGECFFWLTQDELEALSVRKGTLTKQEREIMESHVVMTTKMLGEIDFTPDYANVPVWAGAHHEFLNGEGYPNGLSAEQIPREVRLLTILDIFDALTARDRPYKMPMPNENAFIILHNMVEEGQIDGDILRMFYESKAWLL